MTNAFRQLLFGEVSNRGSGRRLDTSGSKVANGNNNIANGNTNMEEVETSGDMDTEEMRFFPALRPR